MMALRLLIPLILFFPYLVTAFFQSVWLSESQRGRCPADHITYVPSDVAFTYLGPALEGTLATPAPIVKPNRIEGIQPSHDWALFEGSSQKTTLYAMCLRINDANKLVETTARDTLNIGFKSQRSFRNEKNAQYLDGACVFKASVPFQPSIRVELQNADFNIKMTLTQGCPDGLWGYLCQGRCECKGGTCDVRDGICTTAEPEKDMSALWYVIIGCVVGCIFCVSIILAAIAAFIYTKRRRSRRGGKNRKRKDRDPTVTEETTASVEDTTVGSVECRRHH
ncbi:unnamed protein product, partial [Mesorhabditis spiculigera]